MSTIAVLFYDPAIGGNACVGWSDGSWRMERYDAELHRWQPDGPLNEKGRAALVRQFGLGEFGEALPLEEIATRSAFELERGAKRFERAKSAAVLSFLRA